MIVWGECMMAEALVGSDTWDGGQDGTWEGLRGASGYQYCECLIGWLRGTQHCCQEGADWPPWPLPLLPKKEGNVYPEEPLSVCACDYTLKSGVVFCMQTPMFLAAGLNQLLVWLGWQKIGFSLLQIPPLIVVISNVFFFSFSFQNQNLFCKTKTFLHLLQQIRRCPQDVRCKLFIFIIKLEAKVNNAFHKWMVDDDLGVNPMANQAFEVTAKYMLKKFT